MDVVTATRAYETWIGRQTSLVRSDLAFKHQEMAAGPFLFLRATYYRWAELFPAQCRESATAPKVLAVGDLHLENFGTWRDAEGRLVWGVNDFDEAARLPYTNDLVRLATSVRLAADMHPIKLPFKQVCAEILTGYTSGLEKGGRPVVLEEGYPYLRSQAINELRNPAMFWAAVDRLPKATRPPAGCIEALRPLLPQSATELTLRGRRAGLGSLGHPRVVAVAQWCGSRIAREAKASVGPATAWLAEPREFHPATLGRQAIDRAVRCPDPYVLMQPAWTIRRLAPDCSRIELVRVPRKGEQDDWLRAMGWEVANIHLGTARAVPAILADLRRRPARWLRDASLAMLAATLADQAAWAKAFKKR